MQAPSYRQRCKESAFVMITCEDYSETLVKTLKSISEIKEIQHTCGNYDVIVKIETDSAKSMREIISMKIRKIEKIRTTTILISSPILLLDQKLCDKEI